MNEKSTKQSGKQAGKQTGKQAGKQAGKRAGTPSIPPVKFTAGGPTEEVREANLEAVQPSPGYPTMAILLADAITKRADIALLDYTSNSTNLRYKVDGVWHPMAPMDREVGDYMLASLKRLANLDYEERRARQEGTFSVYYVKKHHRCRLVSQGVETGERVAIYIDRPRPPWDNLEDMGMRERQRRRLADFINSPKSLVLLTSMPDETAELFWRAALSAGDRFMQDFFVVQDKHKPSQEIINVTPFTFDSQKGETASSAVSRLLLKEPNVVAFPEIGDGKTLDTMSDLVLGKGLSVLTRIDGRDVFDALLRVLVLEPDVDKFAQSLSCVVAQRPIRKLCPHCRQPFTPSENLLHQLGLPAGRVGRMYTHFQPKPEELVDSRGNPVDAAPCPKCGGPGYFERTNLFELLVVDDKIRRVLKQRPTRQALTAAAAESGHISIRDEGVLLVAKGVTSLEELRRVLKQ